MIAQIAKALERYLHHACPERSGNFGGVVGAVGVDDNDFVRPEHAFDCGFDFLGFVECQDIG